MKRVFATFFIFASLLFPTFSFAGTAGAVNIFQNACSGDGASSTACQSVNAQNASKGDNPIIDIIRLAIQIISYIIGAAAVIGIIVSAIRMIISGGDSNAMASARSGIITSLAGIAIASLALVIVGLVIPK